MCSPCGSNSSDIGDEAIFRHSESRNLSSEDAFAAQEVLEWYRVRWQVELVFKRFKSLAQLGHLPKYDDESARAWLYGKLLVALLVEKLIGHASAISPWGYDLEATVAPQRVA